MEYQRERERESCDDGVPEIESCDDGVPEIERAVMECQRGRSVMMEYQREREREM